MKYYKELFNYNNTLGLSSLTKEHLACLGVDEASVGWNDERMKDYSIEIYPIGIILPNKYNCRAPIGMELYDAY